MRGTRVLVVDDAMLDRDVIVRLLASRGFQAEAVGDAAACMEHLERQRPALLLLDVSMPKVSGMDLLRVIRQRWSAEELPVIMVSARTDSEDVVAGLEAGANDYVIKPVNLPILTARIGVALKIKHSVERLVEAERHREKLKALGDACDHLAPPLERMIGQLHRLIGEAPPEQEELRAGLRETLDLAARAADLIGRLQAVARYRTAPYTEGLGGFVSASLERVNSER